MVLQKPAKEMGSLRLYEKRKLEEPAIKEYKALLQGPQRPYPLWSDDAGGIQYLVQEARRKRDDCVAGKLSLEEFVAWLDSDRQS